MKVLAGWTGWRAAEVNEQETLQFADKILRLYDAMAIPLKEGLSKVDPEERGQLLSGLKASFMQVSLG